MAAPRPTGGGPRSGRGAGPGPCLRRRGRRIPRSCRRGTGRARHRRGGDAGHGRPPVQPPRRLGDRRGGPHRRGERCASVQPRRWRASVPADAETAARIQSFATVFGDDGQLNVTVDPAQPGTNVVHVYFLDAAGRIDDRPQAPTLASSKGRPRRRPSSSAPAPATTAPLAPSCPAPVSGPYGSKHWSTTRSRAPPAPSRSDDLRLAAPVIGRRAEGLHCAATVVVRLCMLHFHDGASGRAFL